MDIYKLPAPPSNGAYELKADRGEAHWEVSDLESRESVEVIGVLSSGVTMDGTSMWMCIKNANTSVFTVGNCLENEEVVAIAYGTASDASGGGKMFKAYVSGTFSLSEVKATYSGTAYTLKQFLTTSGVPESRQVPYANTMAIKVGSRIRFKA